MSRDPENTPSFRVVHVTVKLSSKFEMSIFIHSYNTGAKKLITESREPHHASFAADYHQLARNCHGQSVNCLYSPIPKIQMACQKLSPLWGKF